MDATDFSLACTSVCVNPGSFYYACPGSKFRFDVGGHFFRTAADRFIAFFAQSRGDIRRLKRFDNSVRALGLKVLRTPFRSPKANSICERVIGTVRREFLDWIIPVSETHLRATFREWVTHYNAGRPHKMLGPGVPSPPALASVVPQSEARHRLPARTLVHAKSVLGGLHHEYSFAAAVAGSMKLEERLQAPNICALHQGRYRQKPYQAGIKSGLHLPGAE